MAIQEFPLLCSICGKGVDISSCKTDEFGRPVHSLKTIRDRIFTRELVRFDGHSFLACSFEECTIQYGGEACEWQDCQFSNCRVILDGAAHNTAQVLEALGTKSIPPDRPAFFPSAKTH